LNRIVRRGVRISIPVKPDDRLEAERVSRLRRVIVKKIFELSPQETRTVVGGALAARPRSPIAQLIGTIVRDIEKDLGISFGKTPQPPTAY
jgi:hypothetical protein